MLAGELYDPSAPELQADLAAVQKWLAHYNAVLELDSSGRHELLAERFADVHCDCGFNISLGARALVSFNCVILDVVEVTIGAGGVVTRDVATGATVFGNPARGQG